MEETPVTPEATPEEEGHFVGVCSFCADETIVLPTRFEAFDDALAHLEEVHLDQIVKRVDENYADKGADAAEAELEALGLGVKRP